MLQTFDIWGHHSGTNEPRLLDHVRSIPDGSIVLMAVYDSANPCEDKCQAALGLVGATQQGFVVRGKKNEWN